jgi:hypothetical protein
MPNGKNHNCVVKFSLDNNVLVFFLIDISTIRPKIDLSPFWKSTCLLEPDIYLNNNCTSFSYLNNEFEIENNVFNENVPIRMKVNEHIWSNEQFLVKKLKII